MRKILTVALAVLFLMAGMTAHAEIYPKVFVVESVYSPEDIMILSDMMGFAWEVFGVEDYQPGDCVGAIMEDNGTEELFDDEVVSIRYCGWFDGDWGCPCN